MENKKIKKLFLKFLTFVLSIFALVATFSTILNVMSYQNLVTQIYKDSSLISVTSYINNIKYAVSFGKPIEKFYGMDDILKDALDVSSDFLSVGIVNGKGEILYNVGTELNSVPTDLLSNDYVESDKGVFAKSSIDENSHLFLLLNKDYVSKSVNQYIKNIVMIDLFIAIGLTLLLVLIFFIIFYKNNKKIAFNSLKVPGIVTLILAQLIMGIFVAVTYTNKYQESVSIIKDRVSVTIKSDLEKILDEGIPLEEITGLDEYFNNLVLKIPEFDSVYLTNRKVGDSTSEKITSGNRVYYININSHIDEEVIFNKIVEVSIDALVLMIITVLLSLEISLFIGNNAEKKKRLDLKMNLSGIRLFFFIIQLALSLDAGFISIVSYNVFKKLNMANPPQFLSGLPVTLGIVSIILGILFWGKFIFKLGLKKSIIWGTVCASLGLIASSFSSSLLLLCISRFIYGFGMAAILSVTRVCVSAQDDIKERTKFSSVLSIGMLVGSSCGVVIGGLLADRTSYSFVFFLAGVLSILSLLLIPITNISNKVENIKVFSFKEVKRIIKFPKAFLFIFLLVVPTYIASMFVGYSIPLFGGEINLSQTIISAMIMINYIITAYLTDPLSRVFLKRFGIKKSLYIYEFVTLSSITLFCIINIIFSSFGVFTAIVSVAVLAVADSFGLIALSEFLNTLDIKGVGRTTASLVFILASKIGACLAPTLVSMGLPNGVVKATIILPSILLLGFVIYILSNSFIKKSSKV